MKKGAGLEFEAKFLDVDVSAVRATLKKCGGKLVHGEKVYHRTAFNLATDKIRGFCRVRDEGDVYITCKTYANPDFPDETEIKVDATYQEAVALLTAIGINKKAVQESVREKWSFPPNSEVHEITFDTIPGLPTYLEVDCTSERALNEMIKLLKLDESKKRFGAFDRTYEEYYGIPRAVINEQTPHLTFANILNEIKPTKNKELLAKLAKEQHDMVSKLSATKAAGRRQSRRSRKSRTPARRVSRKR
jgi:adenylate cyclase class 2